MRLNPRCPELRGAANPNQARYHCPFAVPIRRSNIPGHIGFRMEKLGQNIKFLIFSEMSKALYFLFSRGIQFQSWVAQPKTPSHPSQNSLWEQPVDHHLRSGDYRFCLKV